MISGVLENEPEGVAAQVAAGRDPQVVDEPRITRQIDLSQMLCVLVVSGDRAAAERLRLLLADAGAVARVACAGTIAEAERLAANGTTCVLLDLESGLPDASSLGGLVRIRAAAPEAAILALTTSADTAHGVEAVAAGAQDALVQAQLDHGSLIHAIRHAVERRRGDLAQRELREARVTAAENVRIQRGLLPRPIVHDPRIAVATTYRPGGGRRLLGGDFLDVVEDDDGTLRAVVGDVSGHGPDEAAVGVALRIAWRTLAHEQAGPDTVLRAMTRVLVAERYHEDVFATLCHVVVAPDRRRATIHLAGHPAPVLLAGAGARLVGAERPRLPLGVGDVGPWPGGTVALPSSGWGLFAYTDGLIDARIGPTDARLGDAGLCEVLGTRARRGGDDLVAGVLDDVSLLNGGDLTDDVAAWLISSR